MPIFWPTSAMGFIFASRATSISDLTAILFFPPANSRRRLNMVVGGKRGLGFGRGLLEAVSGTDRRRLGPFRRRDLLTVRATHAFGHDRPTLGRDGNAEIAHAEDAAGRAVAGDLGGVEDVDLGALDGAPGTRR